MSERDPHAGPSGITIVNWRPIRRNTLRGFASVKVNRINLRIDDVAIHRGGDARGWAALPSKPMLDSGGSVLRDEMTGKVRYQALLQWTDRETADRFSAAVIAELLARHPAAFDGGAP